MHKSQHVLLLQDVKLQVGLLQNEVEVRGRQIDALLSKLDTTADRIVDLTVEIKSLNSRQEEHACYSLSLRGSELQCKIKLCLPSSPDNTQRI